MINVVQAKQQYSRPAATGNKCDAGVVLHHFLSCRRPLGRLCTLSNPENLTIRYCISRSQTLPRGTLPHQPLNEIHEFQTIGLVLHQRALIGAVAVWKADWCHILLHRPRALLGSVSVQGACRASVFDHSPFAPPYQTICPREGMGDVATSDFVPFYWGPLTRQGLRSQSPHFWAPEKAGVM